ncbi:MAG: putative secreted protease [uncultured Nocardioidaceae bacterium]|uniref:Putative secreted protease n=1 Tax=uncultured Nocardioidaceae bacterium TaxID=253824 RepID=A0A6J4MCN4_9ACTN|nr:MAG: putative secreted protease [uncultured Nocardioidaceae bacterium]
MRKPAVGLLSLTLAAGLGTAIGSPAVSAPAAEPRPAPPAALKVQGHEKPNPLADKRRALKEEALTQVLNGTATPQRRGPSTVVKVGTTDTAAVANSRGTQTAPAESQAEYVELSRETTDRVFVVLAEFGNQRHPKYPDKDLEPSIPGPQRFNGPLHNQIPRPDRSEDNSTYWEPNFGRSYFRNIYFGQNSAPGSGGDYESVRQYYERQSSGRYSISGYVSPWTKVRFNEARYGRSSDDPTTNGDDPNVCADVVCSTTWNLVKDSVNRWYLDQREAGKSRAEIRAQLKSFDVWDRYDHDGDGDFNEADGYLDHFQMVHAGGDEADGDPIQGEDAIWSHRWYVQTTPIGGGGPAGAPFGGTEIGDTGIWVGDYTTQSENGGMSTIAHEYGHDLDLPDLYDTSGGGENSVNWWSLMAQSRVSARGDQAISTRAADLGAWDKLFLGWLDYDVARMFPGDRARKFHLGPHEYNSAKAQAAVVVLPKRTRTLDAVPPYAGDSSWWSDQGNNVNNTMARRVNLNAGTSTLRMQARWDIEDCGPDPCDYAYVEVDDGSGWEAIPGSITTAGEGNGIDGTQTRWTPATFDLSAYSGDTVGLRMRYLTDGAVSGNGSRHADGFFADQVRVVSGGDTLFTSGAENPPEGWTLNGFHAVDETYQVESDNYYIASHRDYVSFDRYLRSGPYNFGFTDEQPNRVEHFPYQDGLLLNYWDTFYEDNNTSEHPGEGMILPVDSHPRPIANLDGEFWRPRIAGYDAPFTPERADSFTLHYGSQEKASYINGRPGQPMFRDDRRWWYPETPTANVKVPNVGVSMNVFNIDGTSLDVRVWNRR